MTASEVPAPTPHEDAGFLQIPSVLSLLLTTYKFLATPPNASVLLGFAGWLFIPVLVSLGSTFLAPGFGNILDVISGVMIFALSIWATAAITIMVTGLVRPDLAPKDTATSVSELAWRRAPTLLWVGLLTGLLQAFGFLFLIIPGIIFSVWFAFAETEVILTGAKVFSSLAQSRERVQGYFWAILWRLFAPLLLLTLFTALTVWPLLALSGITDPMVVLTTPPAWLNAYLSTLEIILMPVILTYQLHLYFSLRKP